MKRLPILFYFNFILSIFLISCEKETIYEENTLENLTELDYTARNNNLCRFTLNGLQPNASIGLTCVIDLKGKNLLLPSNVKLQYSGGSITNGTVTFKGGEIDSRLMNKNLSVKGNFALIDNTFILDATQWDIVQGPVSNAIAKVNKNTLQNLFNKAKEYGALTFEMDRIDAFFRVDDPTSAITPENAAIKIPSNFKLMMTTNTHLRMQPNAFKRPTLLSISGGKVNVTISGGNLYGDRNTHDYSGGGTHEWGHTLRIKGADNVTIENVNFEDATGDAINISGLYHYYETKHIASKNILIKNNRFYQSRRINLSITSGNHITIENNTFIDGGIDTPKSKGASPRCNLNIEPYRRWKNNIFNGDLIEYEKVSHIFVRNNIQKGRGAFFATAGDTPIIFDGNKMESSISFSIANGVQIKNNIFKANSEAAVSGYAISAGVCYATIHKLVYNNEIFNNKIYGYRTGINAGGKGNKIYSNHIEARSGIVTGYSRGEGLIQSEIYKNTIIADQYGITIKNLARDLNITNNTIDANSFPLFVKNVNNNSSQQQAKFQFKNNVLRGKLVNNRHTSKVSNITNTYGMIFENNTIQGGLEIVGSKNLNVLNNTFKSQSTHGVRFFKTPTTNSKISLNKFSLSGNYKCFYKQVTLNNSVTFTSNMCN